MMLGFVMAVIWKVVKSDVVVFVLEPAFYYLFIQSLEQQFDYLFKCAGVKLISCWDLKEHHIIIIIIKNQKVKISIEFPQYFICLQ